MQAGPQFSDRPTYHFTAEARSELQFSSDPSSFSVGAVVAGIGRPSPHNDGNSFLLNRSVIIVKSLEWRLGD